MNAERKPRLVKVVKSDDVPVKVESSDVEPFPRNAVEARAEIARIRERDEATLAELRAI